jgi:hypothetical protein
MPAHSFVPPDPADYLGIVGRTFANAEHQPVLAIGQYVRTRADCPHSKAAAALNRFCLEHRITTIRSLARQVHLITGYRGMGLTCYWFALSILKEHGYDLQTVHGAPTTYLTLKRKALKALKKSRRDVRRPRRAGPPSDSAPEQRIH